MPGPPEQLTVMPSRLWERLFRLWVFVGFLLVEMSILGCYKCPPRPGGYPTFRFVGAEAEYEAYDRGVAVLTFLAQGALAYGLLGVLVFFRRGCGVFFLAGVVVAICGYALLDATWVDL
jgi:hypothetical protein